MFTEGVWCYCSLYTATGMLSSKQIDCFNHRSSVIFKFYSILAHSNIFSWLAKFIFHIETLSFHNIILGRRGRDRVVVVNPTTYVISAYHHWCCEFESRSGRGVQHYVIIFVSDLRQFGSFRRVLRFHPSIKLTGHDVAEILLKVALNTIKQTNII